MADFCNQCATDLCFPLYDLKGLVEKEDYQNGLAAIVICEGCGTIFVDPEGNCISPDCLRCGHGRVDK